MTPLLKNLLIALGLVVLLYIGYVVFLRGDDEALLSSSGGMGRGGAETQEFLTRLQRLRSITLDTSVIDDVRFEALVDFRQQIIDEPTGRQNPFAPVE